MAKPLHGQLNDAWRASALTLDQLITLAKLKMGKATLSKKLAGHLPLKTHEAESLAAVLRVRISTGREARAS